jgi:hypothetical protein
MSFVTTRRASGLVLAAALFVPAVAPAQEAGVVGHLPTAARGTDQAGGLRVARVEPVLLDLLAAQQARRPLRQAAGPLQGTFGAVQTIGESVAVHAISVGEPDRLLKQLQALGLTGGETAGGLVEGFLPVAAIPRALGLSELRSLRAARQPGFAVGSVDTQGDLVQGTFVARPLFDVDGTGSKIGMISDSFNRLGGAAAGIASGDLPGPGNPFGRTTPVQIVEELATDSGITPVDEGRGLLEIVHDVAPGARLAFATAFPSIVRFANNIRRLADAGCNVIDDDVFFGLEDPWFQDGLASQAIQDVVNRGVTYVTSAGNSGRFGYESGYRPSLTRALAAGTQALGNYQLHDFDPGAGVDVFQALTVPAGSFGVLALQWDQPFASNCAGCPGAASDLDILFASQEGNFASVFSALLLPNLGADASDAAIVQNTGTVPVTVYVLIGKFLDAGPTPNPGIVKWVDFGNIYTLAQWAPNGGSTVVGHTNAGPAISVGAADYRFPFTPEPFSSVGGTRVVFNRTGQRISPVTRQKPDLVAPDNVDTSFFVPGRDPDFTGFPNCQGTSCSAPHVAGLAALMEEVTGNAITPAQIKSTLIVTADDLDNPYQSGFQLGFDFATGWGLVDGFAAVAKVAP